MSFLNQPLQDVLFGSGRMIGSIKAQVVIQENTNDTLTITKQPVQQGASITDHAYREPTTFNSTLYFRSDASSDPKVIYQQFQDLQNSRVPFTIVTTKRTYKNMLIAALGMTVDKNTENCLALSISCQEVIIVSVTTVNVPRTQQKDPGTTGATQQGGKKSILKNLSEGVTGGLMKIPGALSP